MLNVAWKPPAVWDPHRRPCKRRMTESKVQSAKKLTTSGIPPRKVARNLGVSVPLEAPAPRQPVERA